MVSRHSRPTSTPAELLGETLSRIAPLTKIDDVGRALCSLVSELYHLSFFGVSVWQDDRRLFVERAYLPPEAEPLHVSVEELDKYVFGAAIKSGKPRLVGDVDEESVREGEWTACRQFGTRSYVYFPFAIRRRLAGTLGLGSKRRACFGPVDVASLERVAELLGLKFDALGITPPATLDQPAQDPLPSIALVGLDGALCSRIAISLPEEIPIQRIAGDVASKSV